MNIKENQGSVENLLCLIAADADVGSNANLTYSIVDGNSRGLFSLHPALGILSVRHSLDFEKIKEHQLTVCVTDDGKPSRNSTAKVKVIVEDANDPPVFLQKTYEGIKLNLEKICAKIPIIHSINKLILYNHVCISRKL